MKQIPYYELVIALKEKAKEDGTRYTMDYPEYSKVKDVALFDDLGVIAFELETTDSEVR